VFAEMDLAMYHPLENKYIGGAADPRIPPAVPLPD
jgi:hypothetical protein